MIISHHMAVDAEWAGSLSERSDTRLHPLAISIFLESRNSSSTDTSFSGVGAVDPLAPGSQVFLESVDKG